MPVDGDAIFFANSFQQIAGNPNLVTGLLGAFGEDLEFPLASSYFGIDAFHVQAGFQTGVEMFFHHIASVGVEGADGTIIGSLRSWKATFGKTEGFVGRRVP